MSVSREPRTKPRTTCDQCGRDYAEDPESCVTILLQSDEHYNETVCVRCVGGLGYTGCIYRRGEPTEYILGRAAPPAEWSATRVEAEELLCALSSIGYMKPPRPSETMDRISIAEALDGLEWVRVAKDEAA